MIIASPSMSTKAVIMRTVNFPLISLFSRHQRGGNVSNDRQRLWRDLVHRILRSVVRGIGQIDDVDDSQPGVEQGDVVVGDQTAALLHEDVAVAEVCGCLPHSGNDIGNLLKGIHLVWDAQIFVTDHVPKDAEGRLVPGRWEMSGEIL